MIEEAERRSLDKQLDLERTDDEISKCGKSRITYTRASLLEFTEAEVCSKLPGDFDLLSLSELNGAADGTVGHKRISDNSSILGALPSSRWDTGVPGERWDNHLLVPSKESHSQGNRISERSDVVSQQLRSESGYDAAFLGQNTPKSGLFQLTKSENPYRPPHCTKKIPQPLDTFSDLEFESSASSSLSAVESDQRGSADSITGNDKPGNNDVNEMVGAYDKLGLGIIDDNQPTFEDFWADILESLRLQQEAELKSTPTPDSEIEICLPDEDSLISLDHSIIPKALNFDTLDNSNDAASSEAEIVWPDEDSLISLDHSIIPKALNFNTLDNSDDAANSEAEIIWPDDDSLISFHDLIGPNSLVPTFNEDFVEADKLTSDMAGDVRKNSEKPFFHRGNGHMNFLTKSNYIPYMPVYQPCFTNTNPNDSLIQYSLFQQPNICPKQQNRMQYLNSQQTTYQGFGNPNTGGFVDKKASGFWHALL